jgi:predicted nucleic acid-binding protein
VAALLIDTDVLIDLLWQRREAVAFVAGLDGKPTISALTVAELLAGFRNASERSGIDRIVDGCTIIPVDRNLAEEGGLLRRKWMRSHGVGLVDAILAATAIRHSLRLATRNRKHFPMLDDLLVPY